MKKKKLYCQNCGSSVKYKRTFFGAFGRKCKKCKSKAARFTKPNIPWNRENNNGK